MDLPHKYGEDGAEALYMWRFAGVSFGLESRFWWTLLGSMATASITAVGAIAFKVIQTRLEDATWMTEELERGLPFDGSTAVPPNTTAFAEWGSGEWAWMGYSVAGGAIISGLKFIGTLLAVLLAPCVEPTSAAGGVHSRVFPKLTPNLVVEAGSLQGHVVHSVFVLLCGAVSIGTGASVGPEAPNGSFGAGMGSAVHRLLTCWGPCRGRQEGAVGNGAAVGGGDRGFAEEYVLVGMAVAFVNIFPGLLIALALMFELNAATTLISAAAVEAALRALRASRDLVDGQGGGQDGQGRSAARGGCLRSATDNGAKTSFLAPGELPHSRFRFDYPQFFIVAAISGGLGMMVYTAIEPNTFLSQADFTDERLLLDTGVTTSEAFIFALREAWQVKPWHYPAAVGLALVGALLGVAGEVVGVLLETLGLKLLCRMDDTRLNGLWLRLWARLTCSCATGAAGAADFECLSLGAALQPLLGGVLVGLWNVLQPYCLGEGTTFFQYLFTGVNGHTLTPANLIGIGFVKLLATRTALGFGFVGGKFFPTMFLGGCVGCAIYEWCNPDAESIVQLAESDVPLLFPFACLMSNSVTALGPMFVSIALCVAFIFGLTGDQVSVVVVSCTASYLFVHGLGKGLLPMIMERKVLLELPLLEGHDETDARRRSGSGGAPGATAGRARGDATAPAGLSSANLSAVTVSHES